MTTTVLTPAKGARTVARNSRQPESVAEFLAEPAAEIVAVTPELATRWLQCNEAGRRLRDMHVVKYADDMKNGRWFLSGDAVKFDVEGNVRDGQHRLKAVEVSGATVKMFVVRGLAPEAQLYMDTGVKRTVADQLTIRGYDNVAILSTGARLALAWTTEQLSDHIVKISDAAIRDFIDANPGIKDAAAFAHTVRCGIPQSSICAVVWRLIKAGHDTERVHDFFRALADYRSTGRGDPKYTLLHRVNTARQRRERIKQTQMMSMLIRAFNASYLGEEIFKMNLVKRSGGLVEIPEIVAPTQEREAAQRP